MDRWGARTLWYMDWVVLKMNTPRWEKVMDEMTALMRTKDAIPEDHEETEEEFDFSTSNKSGSDGISMDEGLDGNYRQPSFH